MAGQAVDPWATGEVHFQQHGLRCQIWIPPKTTDSVLLHAPTRRSVRNRYFPKLDAVIGVVEAEFDQWTGRDESLRRLPWSALRCALRIRRSQCTAERSNTLHTGNA
jgi:hypothetical protein